MTILRHQSSVTLNIHFSYEIPLMAIIVEMYLNPKQVRLFQFQKNIGSFELLCLREFYINQLCRSRLSVSLSTL